MKNIREDMRDLRRDFNYGTLDAQDVPLNPFDLLKVWLDDAVKLKIKDANAFVLSTSVNNQPDSRVVLIRDISDKAIHFYTNYGSKKASELASNSKAAMNIFWPDMDRQIRMQVEVKKLDEKLSDDYFKTRPRKSQIGAWASTQSEKLESREKLKENLLALEKQFEGQEVPRPDFWGGFELVPSYFEFWQGRPSRLHDRIIYEGSASDWKTARLYP
ncbi:pyridoxamine 5'-phosphate oxidase [Vicingaceae bacterium]|nr:pyridoxamine 5'-phosphate oxidase [Vicingaceae bacterium]MDC1451694.1 pyridoxamine 5'-phosphate oxidase [Vicingaceae bacterium]